MCELCLFDMTSTPEQPESIFALFDWSPTLSAIVAGLVVVGIATWIPKSRPYVVASCKAIVRAVKWTLNLRVISKKSRNLLFQSGYDTRDSEIVEERRRSAWPSWSVSTKSEFGDDCYVLYNHGWAVTDVSLEVDPALFVLEGDGFFSGSFGDNTPSNSKGRQFRGRPTELGRAEGVVFSLRWFDQHGDEQPATSGETRRGEVTMKPKLRIVRPSWQVGRPKHNPSPNTYAVANGAKGFVGTNISIDAPSEYFTFILTRELGDLTDIGLLRFTGRPSVAGQTLGFNFQISYTDVNGDLQVDDVPADFGIGF